MTFARFHWVHYLSVTAAALACFTFPRRAAADMEDLKVDLSPPPKANLTTVCSWDNLVWLGTEQGLYRCRIAGTKCTTVPMIEARVRCFIEDQDEIGKSLLIGTAAGLYRIRPPAYAAVREQEKLNNIRCLAASLGTLWIGNGNDLWRLQKKDLQRVAQFNVPVNCLVYRDSQLFVGTTTDLWQRDPQTGEAKWQLQIGNVSALSKTADALWYATGYPDDPNQPPKTWLLGRGKGPILGCETGYVYRLVPTATGLWVAGAKGIYRVSRGATEPKNPLALEGEVIDAFRQDDTIWVVTPSFLYRLNGANEGEWDPGISVEWKDARPHFTGTSAVLQWRVANYDHRTTRKHVHFRVIGADDKDLVRPDEVRPLAGKSGGFEATVPVQSTGLPLLRVVAVDLHGVSSRPVEIHDLAVPLGAVIAGVVVLVLLLAVPGVPALLQTYRWALSVGGQAEWQFVTEESVILTRLTVLGKAKSDAWTVTDEDGLETHFSGPLIIQGPDGKVDKAFPNRYETRATGKSVSLRVPLDHFSEPWARSIGDDLCGLGKRTVAGQLALRTLAHPGPPARPVVFAGLACLPPSDMFEELRIDRKHRKHLEWHRTWDIRGRLSRRIRGGSQKPQTLRDLIEEQFYIWGATILRQDDLARTAASPELFFEALRHADIVHVVAHGGMETAGLCLYNNQMVTAADLMRDRLPEIRCRLLVLTVCKAGSLNAKKSSFVYPLVERGVRVVAAAEDLDQVASVVFFREFYRALFPSWRAQGRPIAEAMRAGGAACWSEAGEELRDQWAIGINSLTLFGNPATSLRFIPDLPFRSILAKLIRSVWERNMGKQESLLWRALNREALPRAQDAHNTIGQLVKPRRFAADQREGAVAGVPSVPAELVKLHARAEVALAAAGTGDTGKPPSSEVLTLAFYKDAPGLIAGSLRKTEWWFWLYFFSAVACIVIFVGAGAATILGAVVGKMDVGQILGGAGLSVGGGLATFLWNPLEKLRVALVDDTRLKIVRVRYLAKVEACKAAHDLSKPEGIVAAVTCINQVTDAFLDELK